MEDVEHPVLAVDIGGTKLAAGLVASDGRILSSATRPTAGAASGDELFERLLETMREAAGSAIVTAIGVGCGGPMKWPEGEVSPLNIEVWRDYPIRVGIVRAWPEVPVRMHNDAIAMAAGEHWIGAGQGYDDMLGVVISTGVGGGIISRGRLIEGPSGNAGHVGHVVVDADGPPCGCGGRGCLEAIARGPRTVEWAVAQGWCPESDAAVDGRSLVASAQNGDAIALAALTRAGRALGIALASTTHLLDLDLVVVGGGLGSGAGDLLLEPARAAFHRHAVTPFAARCKIVPAKLGGDAGLVGAAALVLGGDRYWSLL